MYETFGNLWDLWAAGGDKTWLVITTNGFVKRDGTAVMGRGIALAAKARWPNLARELGAMLHAKGNCTMMWPDKGIFTFPVKPARITANATLNNVVSHMRRHFRPGQSVPGWAAVADPKIIARSAHELATLANNWGLRRILLPRPGCGAGELSWPAIRPILENVLDERFTAVTYGS